MRVSRRYEPIADAASRERGAALVQWLRDYAERRLHTRLIDERRSIPPHVALDFGNAGVFGIQVEPRWGGLGLRNREVARVLEQAAAIDLGLGTWCLTSLFPGVRPIAAFGSDALKERVLPQLAAGRMLAGYAQTEPAAGTHFPAMEARAVVASDGWRLSGEKIWIGNATWAGILTTMAHDVDERGRRRGLTAFAVPTDRRGVELGRELLSLGMRGMVQSEVAFRDVTVDDGDVLGERSKGLEVGVDSMSFSRFAIAATCIGGMKRASQLMLRFAGRRAIATGPLLDHPNVRSLLGATAARIRAVEALVDDVADGLDRGESVSAELFAACKVAGSEFLWEVADELVQVLGSRGYDEENRAPQFLRDARVTRIFEGTSEALLAFLGAAALNERSDVYVYLRAEAGADDLADALGSAVEAMRSRTLHGEPLSRPWLCNLAGRAALDAMAAAALGRRAELDPSEGAAAARTWMRVRLDASLADAASGGEGEGTLRERAWLEKEIGGLCESIGDVEQSLPGERRGLDPLLRRDPAEDA